MCLSIHPGGFVSIYLFLRMSLYLSLYLVCFIYFPMYLELHPFIQLSPHVIYLVYLSCPVYPFIYRPPPVSLSTYLFCGHHGDILNGIVVIPGFLHAHDAHVRWNLMELRGPRLLLRQQALEWPVHWPGGLQEEVFGEEQLPLGGKNLGRCGGWRLEMPRCHQLIWDE